MFLSWITNYRFEKMIIFIKTAELVCFQVSFCYTLKIIFMSKRNSEKTEDLETVVFRLFAEDVVDYRKAVDVYASLCNMRWLNPNTDELETFSWRTSGGVIAGIRNSLGRKGDENFCALCGNPKTEHYMEVVRNEWSIGKGPTQVFSFPIHFCFPDTDKNRHNRDKFIPNRLGSEDYLDFYCSGGEGYVPEWVEKKMLSAGWKKSPYPDDD
jgi:hypothetical protein